MHCIYNACTKSQQKWYNNLVPNITKLTLLTISVAKCEKQNRYGLSTITETIKLTPAKLYNLISYPACLKGHHTMYAQKWLCSVAYLRWPVWSN